MSGKSILVALVITSLLFLVTDCTFSNPERMIGVVSGRHYKPEKVWYTTDDKGRMTTHRESEEFHVMVNGNGRIIKVQTDEEIYSTVKEGQTLHYHANIGCMTGINWGFTSSESENRPNQEAGW